MRSKTYIIRTNKDLLKWAFPKKFRKAFPQLDRAIKNVKEEKIMNKLDIPQKVDVKEEK